MSSLSLVVEGNACSWGRLGVQHGNDAMRDVMRAVISFANAHLSLSAANRLLLLAFAKGLEKKILYNSRRCGSADASAEMMSALRAALTRSIDLADDTQSTPLAASLALAICHMKRSHDATVLAGDSSSPGRIVIVSMTTDFAKEHGILMNVFFSAHAHGVCVDVLSLGGTSPLLQQAADITGGLCIELARPAEMMRSMMTYVLAGPSCRPAWPQPKQQAVDYRAACVCHGTLVAQGWVCSVCLSVLCQFMPICSACGAIFKIAGLPRKNRKRKKDE